MNKFQVVVRQTNKLRGLGLPGNRNNITINEYCLRVMPAITITNTNVTGNYYELSDGSRFATEDFEFATVMHHLLTTLEERRLTND